MSRIRGAVALLRNVIRRRAADQRAREEFSFHVEMETQKNLRLGMSAAEARRNALVAVGGVDRHREEMRDTRAAWIDDVGRDVRMAARALRRTPGFTVAVGASLALGFALGSLALGVAKAYVERSLPYPEPHRLYHVMYAPPGPVEPRGMSSMDWSALTDVVEADITSSGQTYYLTDGGHAQTARGLRVSPGFLSALGVRASIGRSLLPEDFVTGSSRVALVSHTLWRTRFGADSGIVGRDLGSKPKEAPARPRWCGSSACWLRDSGTAATAGRRWTSSSPCARRPERTWCAFARASPGTKPNDA